MERDKGAGGIIREYRAVDSRCALLFVYLAKES
jgi:hypothetical protein